MNRHERRAQQKRAAQYLRQSNARQGDILQPVPRACWPTALPPDILEVWRSRKYLVQVYATGHEGVERLSICRTAIDFEQGSYVDKIPWDDLQRLKSECGRGHLDALEVYPKDQDVVNVANLRHLWVMPYAVPFVWRKPEAAAS